VTIPRDFDATLYARMRWNAPLSEGHAALLLQRLDVGPGADILDLGCGWGELLMRAVRDDPSTRGTGIDNNEWAVARCRRLAAERGCIGASHAYGGADATAAALRALTGIVKPGGRMLYGDACWEHPPPTEAAAAIFGEEVQALPAVVELALAAGWRIIHLSTADQSEWDDFEATWRAGREEWLLAHPDDEGATEVRRQLDRQVRDYIGAYRGVLGFTYLVVAHRDGERGRRGPLLTRRKCSVARFLACLSRSRKIVSGA
jgi:SAM-dependent methyltransferase